MSRLGRRGLLPPGEMFPANEPSYRVSFPRLRSGIRIRAMERGDPVAPPVMHVHGWGCTAYTFRHVMPAVANAGFRAMAVDLKGHGLSDKPQDAAGYTIDGMVEHLGQILDALGLDQPVLVGHSLGGTLVYHFATKYPERVAALGLISPAGLTGVPRMGLYHFFTPRFLKPLFRFVRSRTIIRTALNRVYGKRGHFTERDVEEYLAPAQFPDYGPAIRELLHAYDWEAARHRKLRVLNVPAAGIWGSRDHMMPSNGMDIYRGLLPRIELTRVEDAGHVVAEETPLEVNEALLGLLKTMTVETPAG